MVGEPVAEVVVSLRDTRKALELCLSYPFYEPEVEAEV